MTLIELLKRLAELFPEKYRICGSKGLIFAYGGKYFIEPSNPAQDLSDHADRILAEHGMCMWVESVRIFNDKWRGVISRGTRKDMRTGADFPTKRLVTEATFIAALEYIIKQKEEGR